MLTDSTPVETIVDSRDAPHRHGHRLRRLGAAGALRCKAGVRNYMAYITGAIPVGTYDSKSLAILGRG
jgi:hypothetical protein